jgi:2-amino-4-hydroxy-6-hydroxymethyldihydropteridine diphosphokinase
MDWLDQFQAWEREAGRAPKRVHNEARPLDIDIIAWGGLIWKTPRLVLPHPRAHLRRFVLEPLAELLPDFVLPGQKTTVSELLRSLPPEVDFRRWMTAEELQGG